MIDISKLLTQRDLRFGLEYRPSLNCPTSEDYHPEEIGWKWVSPYTMKYARQFMQMMHDDDKFYHYGRTTDKHKMMVEIMVALMLSAVSPIHWVSDEIIDTAYRIKGIDRDFYSVMELKIYTDDEKEYPIMTNSVCYRRSVTGHDCFSITRGADARWNWWYWLTRHINLLDDVPDGIGKSVAETIPVTSGNQMWLYYMGDK